MVGKIVKAHGYEHNIENLLASIDTLRFGNLVRLKNGKSNESTPLAKEFVPSISFGMPSKSKVGFLLNLFYEEIGGMVAKLSDSKKPENVLKDMEKDEKIKSYKEQIAKMEEHIKYIEAILRQKNPQAASMYQEISSEENLDLKFGTVHKFDYDLRNMIIKSDRQNYKVPFVNLPGFPNVGDHCIIKKYEKSATVDVMFTGSLTREIKNYIGYVVNQDKSGVIKVKCLGQGYWQIKPTNEQEKKIFEAIVTGQAVILSFVDKYFVRIQSIERNWSFSQRDKVHEEIVCYQIGEVQSTKDDEYSGDLLDIKEAG